MQKCKLQLEPLSWLSTYHYAGSDGNIYSKSGYGGVPLRKLAVRPAKNGYLRFNTRVPRHQTHHVHAAICRAYHGEKAHPEMVARHLDGDQLNNRPDNLAWGTVDDNATDRRLHNWYRKNR